MREFVNLVKSSVIWYTKAFAKVASPLLTVFKYVMLAMAFISGLQIGSIDYPSAIPTFVLIAIMCVAADCIQCAIRIKGWSGQSVPAPVKRFTEVSDDGMVSVDQNRLQELLLYVADVEDSLERSGRLR